MEASTVRQNDFQKFRKTIIDILLFIISALVVSVILVRGREYDRINISGTIIVVTVYYTSLYLFLLHFRPEALKVIRKTFFILLSIIIFLLLTKLALNYQIRNIIYIVPYAVIPVIIRTFYDSRLALFTLLMTLLLAGFLVEDPFPFVILNFFTGMVAIYTLTNNFRKSRLFFTSLMVIVSYYILCLGLTIMDNGSLRDLVLSDYILFTVNGFLVLITFPLIIFFEQKFLLISDTTLLMLADPNQPLLRKLATEAPGSYQHSLQVANLAEEAARAIGASMHLVRTGALYHDIGKIAEPAFFIENQREGVSPHDNLDPKESARVIINHVKHGVVLAKNYKIPVQVIDFIN